MALLNAVTLGDAALLNALLRQEMLALSIGDPFAAAAFLEGMTEEASMPHLNIRFVKVPLPFLNIVFSGDGPLPPFAEETTDTNNVSTNR